MPRGNAHLGAEYYNIASALVRGRGFADPFVVESGPSSWMPPLLVWIQAGFIWLFGGDRFWVMVAVVTLKTAVLCGCGVAIVRHRFHAFSGWLAFGVFATFVVAEFWACFSFTHDDWLILAGVTGTVFGLAKIQTLATEIPLSFFRVAVWGCFGGLVALSSPVAGFAWAVGTTICLLRNSPTKLVLAAVMSIVVVLPWTMRNYAVFGKFVPVKGNAYFEFDQSMALDADGLLDYLTMGMHPYHAGPEQTKYVQMGELAYLETKKERFLSQIKTDPHEYLRKVRNRLVGTTLLPAGFSEYLMPSLTLPLRWFLYPWPAIAAIGLLVFGRPLSPLQQTAIVIYVAYLFPYVMCSYYPRYGYPLFTIKILLCFWALNGLLNQRKRLLARLA
jgi:hypothetical protein